MGNQVGYLCVFSCLLFVKSSKSSVSPNLEYDSYTKYGKMTFDIQGFN